MITLRGTCSHFGGPDDTGVSASEGLAFIFDVTDQPSLFLPKQPPGTTGLARRLDPDTFYIATRWDYDVTPKDMLLSMRVTVRAPSTGVVVSDVFPADWGPNAATDRVADLSPGLMTALGIETDDEVIVEYEPIGVTVMPYGSIVISSGHGLKVRGAHGIIDEVDEARRVTEKLAEELDRRGVDVTTFHDDSSTSQDQNLKTIVNFHNGETRDLDISVHFNAFEQTSKPMGTEVLWVTQSALASEVSAAIANAGSFVNRGGKKRSDLYFLNNTDEPAILLEICFVDSTADTDLYAEHFDAICSAIADVLGGELDETEEPDTPPPDRPDRPPVQPPEQGRVDIEISGNVTVTINGVPVTS